MDLVACYRSSFLVDAALAPTLTLTRGVSPSVHIMNAMIDCSKWHHIDKYWTFKYGGDTAVLIGIENVMMESRSSLISTTRATSRS
jgi:hypothetical protein